MEPEQTSPEPEVTVEPKRSTWNTVTPLSKYLAIALFVILPFVGGYVGYISAPEKVIEVEKEVVREAEVQTDSKIESTSKSANSEVIKCVELDSLYFEGQSYFMNRQEKTVTFTSRWLRPDQNADNSYQGCIGDSKELSGVDVESFSVIDQDQTTPVMIDGTIYQNQNPSNVATDPITPLAYDKNQFYINGVVKFSVASGTFEMYQPDGSGNYYVRLGDEEFEMQYPIDMHLIKTD